MDLLQQVLDGAPDYAELVTGSPPGAADALSVFTILPDGKGYDDKFVLGIFSGSAMVGCVDLIRGYPEPETAHIGLLLIAEPFQRRGLGAEAFAAVERLVTSWNGIERLRIGVLRSNTAAHRFWQRLGFRPSGEVKPYRYGYVRSETIVYTKGLASRET